MFNVYIYTRDISQHELQLRLDLGGALSLLCSTPTSSIATSQSPQLTHPD